MLPESSEPQLEIEEVADLFAEPRDHANQWYISAFWEEIKPPNTDLEARPVVE